MIFASGSLARTTTGLHVRRAPDGEIVATLKTGALVECLGKPANGWVRVVARGWTVDGRTIYAEPDVRSEVKLMTRGGWRFVEVQGAVAVRYLELIDGPE